MLLGKKILRCQSGDFVLYLYPILCSSSIGLVPVKHTVRSAQISWPSLRRKVELIYRCKRVTSIDNHITVSNTQESFSDQELLPGFFYIFVLLKL
jgi:hypothetical protein